MNYRMKRDVPLPYEQAIPRVKEALAREGFGVLSEIDVAATLKAKLNQQFRPYVILGACNPPLAFRALSAEQDIGVLLPCNVVVYQGDQAGHSVVAAIDPESSLGRTDRADLAPVATEVKRRLERALAGLPG